MGGGIHLTGFFLVFASLSKSVTKSAIDLSNEKHCQSTRCGSDSAYVQNMVEHKSFLVHVLN